MADYSSWTKWRTKYLSQKLFGHIETTGNKKKQILKTLSKTATKTKKPS